MFPVGINNKKFEIWPSVEEVKGSQAMLENSGRAMLKKL